MEMPTFKEKAIFKINNLAVNYCKTHAVNYKILIDGTISINGVSSIGGVTQEAQKAHKLTLISTRLSKSGEITDIDIDFCNKMDKQLRK